MPNEVPMYDHERLSWLDGIFRRKEGGVRKFQDAPWGRPGGGKAGVGAKGVKKEWEDMNEPERLAAGAAVLAKDGIGSYEERKSMFGKLVAMGTPAAVKLVLVGLRDPVPAIREAAAMELATLSDAPLRALVAEVVLKGGTPIERAAAAFAVGHMPSPEYLPTLAQALSDKDSRVQVAAAESIRRLGTGAAEVDALKALLASPSHDVRVAGVRGLGVRGLATLELLRSLLKDNDPIVRAEAIRGIAVVDPGYFFDKVLTDETDRATPVRIGKLGRLGEMWLANPTNDPLTKALLKKAVEYLGDVDWRVRVRAIRALRAIGSVDVVDALIGDIDREVQNGGGRLLGDVLDGLRDITGQSFGDNVAHWREWWRLNKAGFVPGVGAVEAPEGGGGTIATPKLYDLPVASKRIVLVIDGSGSVTWLNPQAYADLLVALENFVNGLPADAKVAVVLARDRYVGKGDRTWPDAPKTVLMPMTPANKIALLGKVKARLKAIFDAKSGRMDLNDAIEEAMAVPDTDTVVVISDGNPSAGRLVYDENLAENIGIKVEYPSIRIDTVTVKSKDTVKAYVDALMKALADMTGGTAVGR